MPLRIILSILNFNFGILFNNPGGTRLLSAFITNGQFPGVSTTSQGITYTGAGFVNHIQDTLVQNFAYGYIFNSTPVSNQGLEDLQVLNLAYGYVWKCITIESTNTGYGPFNYSFLNMSVNAVGNLMYILECNNIVVHGGNWLGVAPVGSWTGGFNLLPPPENLWAS
jgi:hypothetical protein